MQPVGGDLCHKAGDRFQFVKRAASMAQTPARDHRHHAAAFRQCRRQQKRDAVADAAGRVFVDHRCIHLPVQHIPAVAHRQGQRGTARIVQTLQAHGHGKGACLRVTYGLVGQPSGKPRQFLR